MFNPGCLTLVLILRVLGGTETNGSAAPSEQLVLRELHSPGILWRLILPITNHGNPYHQVNHGSLFVRVNNFINVSNSFFSKNFMKYMMSTNAPSNAHRTMSHPSDPKSFSANIL